MRVAEGRRANRQGQIWRGMSLEHSCAQRVFRNHVAKGTGGKGKKVFGSNSTCHPMSFLLNDVTEKALKLIILSQSNYCQ